MTLRPETRPGRTVEVAITALDDAERRKKHDALATEEPLEIRLVTGGATRTVAITMRTPGNDFELAAGFLHNEGIIRARDEIGEIAYCIDPAIDAEQRYNIVNVGCSFETPPDLDRFERHFTISSSCGICGRAHLDALHDLGVQPVRDEFRIPANLLYELPERMRTAQRVFDATGGLHAAAIFAESGEIIVVREDVGRHNALDKAIGWGVLEGRLPFERSILMVSGRTSYEIVQKAVMARIPVVASVSAPSSLAVALAVEFGITLAGFVRGRRANVYASEFRVAD
jgi:FdhD protein